MKNKELNKVTKITDTNTLVVGIDIGKKTHYAYFRTLILEGQKPFAFNNSSEGFELLTDRIRRFISKHNLKDVVIGFEPTGNYWLPLAYYLKSQEAFKLVQVNGKHTKRFKDVTDNSSNKTDLKDPRVIAQIIIIGSSLQVNLPEGTKADLRELTRSRKSILEDKKSIQNRLHSLLALYFPEILKIFKDITCKTCLHILREYATPGGILKIDRERLEKELKGVSRGRFNAEKVSRLIEYSGKSIGIKEGAVEGYRSTLKAHLDQISLNFMIISNIEKKICELLCSIQEYEILKSIHGLGEITIATVISETGNLSNFRTSRELLKFAGLNLVESSSGDHKSKKRISKIGNEHLRSILYFGALRLVKEGGIYHGLYQKHLEKGMEKKRAIIAIARKLLRTIHGITKHNQEFNTKYEFKVINQAA